MKICWDNLENLRLTRNGKTLCIEHHKEAHKLPGCAYNKLRGCI